nr:immunoglobulin light chain junction region [Macaca mulatta]MOY07737.1 immunoglobulin light chain junction region [Macaca mulatta]MOY09749.1 immunoglobulin light chain junction region [Macaca mulatta]MOY10007.1 immunoglobulin light chain junction region [Macaca mulatta]
AYYCALYMGGGISVF